MKRLRNSGSAMLKTSEDPTMETTTETIREKNAPYVLLIGPREAFGRYATHLEWNAQFHVERADCPKAAGILLEFRPDVILLYIPDEHGPAREAQAAVRELRQHAPVVVFSRAANMDAYMAVMTQGAFDYVTSYTPDEEIDRVLSRAIRSATACAA